MITEWMRVNNKYCIELKGLMSEIVLFIKLISTVLIKRKTFWNGQLFVKTY